MATKDFRASWVVVYKASSNSRSHTGSPIRVGSSVSYQTFIGIPTAVRDALKTSKTNASLKLRMYVYDASPEWDLGKHKLASAPTSSTMPWYTYEKAFQGYGTGWIEFDLSGAVFEDEYKAGTYQGIVLYSGTGSSWEGEAYNTTTYQCLFRVTGDWNDPPYNPTITYPKGGETVDTALNIKWVNNGDPDGQYVKYKTAIYDGSWTYSDWSGNGAQAMNWNMSNFKETSNAQIAVKGSDGELETGWVYSNRFTINHNQAPTAPTQLSPSSGAVKDRTEVVRMTWKHNDDGAQAGFRIAWRPKGTSTWNYYPSSTSLKNSTNQYYDFPANTFAFGDVEWMVQTQDQQGSLSPYSTVAQFKASNPTTAPTMLSPTNGMVWNNSELKIEWSSLNQIEYEVQLYSGDGSTILWSKSGSGTQKLHYPTYLLSNNTTYRVKVRSKDSTTMIWSDYVEVTFSTAFTPPNPPSIDRIEEAGEGVLNVLYGSADTNILPSFVVSTGDLSERLRMYDQTQLTDITLSGGRTVTLNGALKGVEFILNANDIPLIQGAVYRVESTLDVQGGRLYIGARDVNGASLTFNASSATKASSPTGATNLGYTLPAGADTLRVIFYTTSDNTGAVTHSNVRLTIDSVTPTDTIEVFRREYTPTDAEPWIKIAEGLTPEGAFLDFTPASNTSYEYKVRARSGLGTIADSTVKQGSTTFENTILQEANNLSSIQYLRFVTTRDGAFKVDSALQTFAGRTLPVREFGENENINFQLEWEVDEYAEVRQLREILQRRDVLLYRDKYGRRYWVTTDELTVKDKEVKGFVLSTNIEATDYTEDLTKRGEEGAD